MASVSYFEVDCLNRRDGLHMKPAPRFGSFSIHLFALSKARSGYSMDRTTSTRRSVIAALGWPKTKSKNASTEDAQAPRLSGSAWSPPASLNHHQLLPVPAETCIVLTFLVDFLLKNKLHKNDLFLLEPKPNERRKLLLSVEQGEVPEKLSHYSSRSVSWVVLELLAHSFAPLFPPECVAELIQVDVTDNHSDRIECVARTIRSDLSTEQSALIESLLLLLYKLSLKATSQMNATVLGKVVAARLMGSTPSDPGWKGGTQTASTADIGRFLVANAPEIIQQFREREDPHTEEVKAVAVAPHRHSHRATSNAVASAAAIILRAKREGEVQEQSRSSLQNHTRNPLNDRVSVSLSALLMAIIDSKSDKFGLYVDRSPSTGEGRARLLRVKQLLAQSQIQRAEPLDDDPVTLSLAVRNFLLENIHPLLSQSVLSSLKLNQSTGPLGDTPIVSVLRDTIVHKLDVSSQDLLLLLLATVRQALDAGTDNGALQRSLGPCLLPSTEDPESQSLAGACVAVLFSEMHSVVESILEQRERQSATKKLRVCMWVVYWALKLRRKGRQQRQSNDLRTPFTDEMVQSLSRAVEWLIAETNARPSQLRRLYLEGDTEDEAAILIVVFSVQRGKVNLALFSPYSIAAAVQKVLLTVLLPLADPRGTHSPQVEPLKELIRSHFDLLIKHEPLKTVRDELERRLEEMMSGRVTGESGEWISYCGEDYREESLEEISVSDSGVGCAVRPAATLSDWLYHQQLEPHSDEVPFRQPPPGYGDAVLVNILNRLSDALFVLEQSRKSDNNPGSDALVSLLDYLGVNHLLIPRKRAQATLHSIQSMNRSNKILDPSGSLTALEIFETLVVETLTTLRHPAFVALYPSTDDQLTVLFDVWGLADRTITFKSLEK